MRRMVNCIYLAGYVKYAYNYKLIRPKVHLFCPKFAYRSQDSSRYLRTNNKTNHPFYYLC